MNTILIIIMSVSVIIVSIMFVYLLTYKKELRDLKKQIEFISKNDTNMELTSQLQSMEIIELIYSVNKLLKVHKSYKQNVERNNSVFKETITNISHDLRTPLTSAIGYIQLLNKKDINNEKKQEYIEIITSRINEVKKLLDQLFEYSRIEANELKIVCEKINLNNILRDTICMFYNDFIQSDKEPEIDIPDKAFLVYVDNDALKRVFENIINNALIHGNGSFSVKSFEKDNKYYIEFTNYTNSITKEDISQIFERFYTTDKSRNRKTTGLGLSIAKKLICRMGGEINAWCENEIFGITINFIKASLKK